jgi:uncharacterized membrane protein
LKPNQYKIRGGIYFVCSVVFGIVSLVGIVMLTVFFLMDSISWESFFEYLVFMALYGAIGFVAVIFYGTSKIYLKGPSPERKELERIRKKTNRTRNQL